MRDASTPKQKLAAKILHVHSFVVLFFYFLFFFLHGDLEFWLDVFHPTNLRSKNTTFLKNLIKQCFKFCCTYYQVYLIEQI